MTLATLIDSVPCCDATRVIAEIIRARCASVACARDRRSDWGPPRKPEFICALAAVVEDVTGLPTSCLWGLGRVVALRYDQGVPLLRAHDTEFACRVPRRPLATGYFDGPAGGSYAAAIRLL